MATLQIIDKFSTWRQSKKYFINCDDILFSEEQRNMASQLQQQNLRLLTNTESITTQEKELREQLHKEIENKSKSCSNPTYECSIPRIDGYDFCIRHILRDPRSGYRQCIFIFSNGKKCTNAVPKQDLKKDPALTTLCFEHSRQMQLNKTRNHVGRLKRVDNNDALLHSLTPHLRIDAQTAENNNRQQQQQQQNLCELDEEIDVVSGDRCVGPPFVNYEQVHDLKQITATLKKRKRILDYASDSSSEEELVCMSNTAKCHEWQDSDNESVDSQDEDLLKHAGIYTRQEAINISEQKLTTLKGLYMNQIQRLQHMLKEKRRQYLYDIRKERENLCSIHSQMKESTHERLLYEKLKAMNHYHRRHGLEAVLYKKFKEKRARGSAYDPHANNSNSNNKGPGNVKCIFTEGGVKCGEKSLPCCKYCKKHILEDKKQILFRACEVEKSGVVCQETVPCIFDDSTCVLHLALPHKRQYIQKKYESETEEDDMLAEMLAVMHEGAVSAATEPIKVECEQSPAPPEEPPQTTTPPVANCEAGKNITIAHDEAKVAVV